MRQEILDQQNLVADLFRRVNRELNNLRVMVAKDYAPVYEEPPSTSDVNYEGPAIPVQRTLAAPQEEPVVKKLDAWEGVCSDCGAPVTVKFKPNPKWPLRCLKCYKIHKESLKDD